MMRLEKHRQGLSQKIETDKASQTNDDSGEQRNAAAQGHDFYRLLYHAGRKRLEHAKRRNTGLLTWAMRLSGSRRILVLTF